MATFDQSYAETGRQSELDALRAQPGAYEQAKAAWESGGGTSGGQSPEQMAQSIIDAMMAPYKAAFDRAKQFEKDNPFFFDEMLARSSSEERYDPYYEAELKDFVSGIERRRSASVQDERRVLQELTSQTDDYLGRTKRQLDQAVKASEEGFAGAGLFFSGDRLRKTGEMGVEAGAQQRTFLRGQQYSGDTAQIAKERSLADLMATETTGRRQQTATRETALQTDVEQQKKEEKARYELERQQFIGYPLSGGSQSFTAMASFL